MQLRMRRRRNRTDHVRETVREGMRGGRDRASKVATKAVERGSEVARDVASKAVERGSEVARDVAERGPVVARDLAEVSASKVAAVAQERLNRRKPRRARRLGAGMLVLMALGALACGLYVWWQRRREDEEFARLTGSPERPDVSPATPPMPSTSGPAAQTDDAPTSMSSVTPSMPTSAPPAPSTPTPAMPHAFSQVEPGHDQGPRPTWNALTRELPSTARAPRPGVPYRGGIAPRWERPQLPGGSRPLF